MTPSLDFRKSVRLVSDERDYQPVYILKKMRQQKLDHMKYDPSFYKQTEKRLNDLFKSIDESSASDETKVAMAQLKNLDQFNNKFVREKPGQSQKMPVTRRSA